MARPKPNASRRRAATRKPSSEDRQRSSTQGCQPPHSEVMTLITSSAPFERWPWFPDGALVSMVVPDLVLPKHMEALARWGATNIYAYLSGTPKLNLYLAFVPPSIERAKNPPPMTPLTLRVLDVIRANSGQLRNREVLAAAKIDDYRAGEDAIYALVKHGHVQILPDSRIALAPISPEKRVVEPRTPLRLEPGKFYRARNGNIWCCFRVDLDKDEHAQADCIQVSSRGYTEYFYLDGRYEGRGISPHTLIAEVSASEAEASLHAWRHPK